MKKKNYIVQHYDIDSKGRSLWGELLVPNGNEKKPLIICSHGFNSSHKCIKNITAPVLAQAGFAVYYFDFYAGSKHGKSGGKTTEMSPLDEAGQVSDIIDHFKNQRNIDAERIYLLGESQGGFVSSYVACERALDVRALILYYPAFCIMDDVKKCYLSYEDIPEKYQMFNVPISKSYYRGLYEFDIYEKIKGYSNPVLIVHGNADRLVDISYGIRASRAFPNCRLEILDKQNHGFDKKGRIESANIVKRFLMNLQNR